MRQSSACHRYTSILDDDGLDTLTLISAELRSKIWACFVRNAVSPLICPASALASTSVENARVLYRGSIRLVGISEIRRRCGSIRWSIGRLCRWNRRRDTGDRDWFKDYNFPIVLGTAKIPTYEAYGAGTSPSSLTPRQSPPLTHSSSIRT